MRKFLFKAVLVLFVFGIWTEGFGQNFEWSKSMGGVYRDYGESITTDDLGNIYTVGKFLDTVDFDPGIGVHNLVNNSSGISSYNIFIQKLDKNGNFLWAKKIEAETANDIKIDKEGNLIIIGGFGGYIQTVDFDPGIDTFNLTKLYGNNSGYILKLDNNGEFIWAKDFRGVLSEVTMNALTIDINNNFCITGWYHGTVDFNPNIGIDELTAGGGDDVFILKLSKDGDYHWVKDFGGSGTTDEDTGNGIITDNIGNIYTTGTFSNTVDFDPGIGVHNLTAWFADIFIHKLDSSGNFVWVQQIDGGASPNGNHITIDTYNNLYLTGNVGGFNWDFFIRKMTLDGVFLWQKTMASSTGETGNSIITDLDGNIYTTGYFGYEDLDIDPGPLQSILYNYPGSSYGDVFIQKLDSSGGFVWAKSFGGNLEDNGVSLTLDNDGDLLVIGNYTDVSVDFNPDIGVFNMNSNGYTDVFIMKLNQCINTIHTVEEITCDSFIVPSGNEIYTTQGTYIVYDTLSKICGVDSILSINLTIENSTATIDIHSAPSPFTWLDGNTYTTDNNTAMFNSTNAAGCDSVITLNLTIIDTIIKGNITTSLAAPLQNSKVYLIKYYAAQDSVFAADSTITDAFGFYEFPNTFQNAYVKAVPNITNYPNEIPTYNVSSAVFQNADAVYLSYPFGNTDFSTIAGVNPGGNGFISGIVGNGAGKNSKVGQLLPNISLVLMNASNEVVAQTSTDANGYFEFTNLAEESFSIWVDKAGILNNLAPEISLATDNNKDDLKFILHKTYLENITSVGIENITLNNFSVFPNPTNRVITIQNTDVAKKYTVELYSILGEQVFSKTTKKQIFNVDLEKLQLSKGTYLVKIATEKATFVQKIIYR